MKRNYVLLRDASSTPTSTPLWKRPSFWLVVVAIELVLMAVLAPDVYVHAFQQLTQLLHVNVHVP